jgi:hypothetical protein
MATTPKSTLYNWFKRGLKPLESQFKAWLDSYWHKDELIPLASVDGLLAALSFFGADTAVVDTAGGVITLDMAGFKQKAFVGNASFATPKTIAFTNAGNTTLIPYFRFAITATPAITLPAGCKLEQFQGEDQNIFQPQFVGEYEFYITHYNGQFRVRVHGPF